MVMIYMMIMMQCSIVDVKCAPPMGPILYDHARLLDCTRQAPWIAARGGGINLEENYGEVFIEGGLSGGKGGLWDRYTLRRYGGGHRRGHPCNAPPVSEACPGGELGVTTHLCAKRV